MRFVIAIMSMLFWSLDAIAQATIVGDNGQSWTVYENGEVPIHVAPQHFLGKSEDNATLEPYYNMPDAWNESSRLDGVSCEAETREPNSGSKDECRQSLQGNIIEKKKPKTLTAKKLQETPQERGVCLQDGGYYVWWKGNGYLDGEGKPVLLAILGANGTKGMEYGVAVYFLSDEFSALEIDHCVCNCGKDSVPRREMWTRRTKNGEVVYGGNNIDLINEMGRSSSFSLTVYTANGAAYNGKFTGIGEKARAFIDYTNQHRK